MGAFASDTEVWFCDGITMCDGCTYSMNRLTHTRIFTSCRSLHQIPEGKSRRRPATLRPRDSCCPDLIQRINIESSTTLYTCSESIALPHEFHNENVNVRLFMSVTFSSNKKPTLPLLVKHRLFHSSVVHTSSVLNQNIQYPFSLQVSKAFSILYAKSSIPYLLENYGQYLSILHCKV